MAKTKYGINFPQGVIQFDKKRLINQLWKVLPMKENGEEWEKQLNTVINELIGLNEIFIEEVNFLILLSKLESLIKIEEFQEFRKIIFESISLLGELLNE